jgi:hypothetical protein
MSETWPNLDAGQSAGVELERNLRPALLADDRLGVLKASFQGKRCTSALDHDVLGLHVPGEPIARLGLHRDGLFEKAVLAGGVFDADGVFPVTLFGVINGYLATVMMALKFPAVLAVLKGRVGEEVRFGGGGVLGERQGGKAAGDGCDDDLGGDVHLGFGLSGGLKSALIACSFFVEERRNTVVLESLPEPVAESTNVDRAFVHRAKAGECSLV